MRNNQVEPELTVKECEEYKPSNQQLLQEYEMGIRFLSRGCIVNVGCKTIAFETIESAMKEINEYVNNTYETQQKWRKLFDM
jgi:hypothetical protein